jgi:GTP-binding protein
MKLTGSSFIKSASKRGEYPTGGLPEGAFSGRSNVGKSSMINCLLGRRNLARTGATPGRTRLVNFFLVNDNLVLVDLPGYGYAKAPGEMRRDWKRMVEQYFEDRGQLKLVVLIVDLRRGLEPEEMDFLLWLWERGIRCCIAATKSDKLTRQERSNLGRSLREQTGELPAELVEFSAKTGEGREQLWAVIGKAVGTR